MALHFLGVTQQKERLKQNTFNRLRSSDSNSVLVYVTTCFEHDDFPQ